MPHPAFATESVAVVTGGAAGIGFAAARHFAAAGLRVCIADLGAERLVSASAELAQVNPKGAAAILAKETDVSRWEDLVDLKTVVDAQFGGTDILMNNAGIQPGSTVHGPKENWQRVIAVNLWGVVYGSQIFVPDMIARGRAGLVINTGSKQGITTPPGDPAYNVSKAGVKVFTEALAHDFRNVPGCCLSAHLLIPGFVFTDLTANGREEKPAGAWTPDQTVDFMLQKIGMGDFYILCPDNDVTRELDEKRILWAAQDITENRPALSRWHPEYGPRFTDFVARG